MRDNFHPDILIFITLRSVCSLSCNSGLQAWQGNTQAPLWEVSARKPGPAVLVPQPRGEGNVFIKSAGAW